MPKEDSVLTLITDDMSLREHLNAGKKQDQIFCEQKDQAGTGSFP